MEKFRNIEYDYKTIDDTFIVRGLQLNEIVDEINAISNTGIGIYEINTESSINYTFVLADASKLVISSYAGTTNFTVPPNSSVAFELGTRIRVVHSGGNGVNIIAGSGVTINQDDGLLAVDTNGVGELIKIATDVWMFTGDVTAAG